MYAKPLSNFICLLYWPFHDLSYKCDQWSIKIQLLWIRNISINWQFMKNSIWLFKGYGSNVKFWEPLAERKRYINFKDQIQQLNVTRVAWNLICLKIIHVVLWMWNIFHWNLFFFWLQIQINFFLWCKALGTLINHLFSGAFFLDFECFVSRIEFLFIFKCTNCHCSGSKNLCLFP